MFSYLLKIHIACGVLSLILGPFAMFAKKRKGFHTQIGFFYFYLVAGACATSLVLALMQWERSWYLFFVGLFSFSFALKGYWAAKKRKPNWIPVHISGMLGSYIAMVTAFLVVQRTSIPFLNTLPVWVTWALPTLVGSPLVALAQVKYFKSIKR